MARFRDFRTAAMVAGAVGGLSSAAYGLLMAPVRTGQDVIGEPESPPLNADGVYLPDGSGPHAPSIIAPEPLRFSVLGDSSARPGSASTTRRAAGVLLARPWPSRRAPKAQRLRRDDAGRVRTAAVGQIDAVRVQR